MLRAVSPVERPRPAGVELHDSPDEERYLEGMVVTDNGSRIGGTSRPILFQARLEIDISVIQTVRP